MDLKIAVITGSVFAGVLVAGALAAPRSGGDSASAPDSTAVVTAVDNAPVLSQTTTRRSEGDERDEDHHEEDDD